MVLKHAFFFTALSAVLILSCASSAESDAALPAPGGRVNGAKIFSTYCTLCHGKDGKLGLSDAKDLSISQLSKDEMVAVVTNGRATMTPYKNVLSKAEIEAVVQHVRTLKTVE